MPLKYPIGTVIRLSEPRGYSLHRVALKRWEVRYMGCWVRTAPSFIAARQKAVRHDQTH